MEAALNAALENAQLRIGICEQQITTAEAALATTSPPDREPQIVGTLVGA
jgi:hypothetical protein